MANDINSHLWSLLYRLVTSEAMSGTGHDLTQVQDEGLLNTVPLGLAFDSPHHPPCFHQEQMGGKKK